MPVQNHPARALLDSWVANAAPWTEAVRRQAIESRRLATDRAITDAVLSRQPRRVLDLGCGEGWLARALAAAGIEVTGIDASVSLVDAARAAGGGRFEAVDYAGLVAAPMCAGSGFDVAVANFSLLDDDVLPLLRALRHGPLTRGAALIVQTVHPSAVAPPCKDGWQIEDFRGFGSSGAPWQPMPWYFRTQSSWTGALRDAGWQIDAVHAPVHPGTGQPVSLLLVASAAGAVAPP